MRFVFVYLNSVAHDSDPDLNQSILTLWIYVSVIRIQKILYSLSIVIFNFCSFRKQDKSQLRVGMLFNHFLEIRISSNETINYCFMPNGKKVCKFCNIDHQL